jgi:hypothetical protein
MTDSMETSSGSIDASPTSSPPISPTHRRAFIRQELTPSRRVVWLVTALSAGLLVLMSLCSGVWAVRDGETAVTLGALALFGLPMPILLIALAAILEPKPLLRTALFGTSTLLALIAALLFAGSSTAGASPNDALGASTLAMCMAVPVLVLLGLPTLYFGVKVPNHLRTAWATSRTVAATGLVRDKGALTLAQIAQEMGVSTDEAAQILRQLSQDADAGIRFYPEHAMAFSLPHEAERQQHLLHTIAARGQVRLDELTFLLKISRELLHTWLVQLVGRDQFHGYINWQTGILYSADAAALGDSTTCPQCSGRLQLSGRKLVLCSYCGAEIFL